MTAQVSLTKICYANCFRLSLRHLLLVYEIILFLLVFPRDVEKINIPLWMSETKGTQLKAGKSEKFYRFT